MKLATRLPALLALLALAGCGGNAKPSVTAVRSAATVRSATTAPAPGHPCNPADFYMSCVQQQPTVQLGAQRSQPSVEGIDFAWSCPATSTMHTNGWRFGASYLSPDSTKNWSVGCVNAYHQAGIATVPVWESTADRATQGFNAGFSDAFNARHQARALGMPDSRPIDYAVDCDCAASSIYWYFRGADSGTASVEHVSATAAVQLVGIYGGFNQVGAIYASHLVGHTNWQTYAWSFGRWQPSSIAPLEQYLNGSSFDHDRALSADYGQWPYAAPKPKPKPVDPHYSWYVSGKFPSRYGVLNERSLVQSYDRLRRNPVIFKGQLLFLEKRMRFLAARIKAVSCQGKNLGEFPLPCDVKPYHRLWRYQHLAARANGRRLA